MKPQSIAIVGSGLSGLSLAYWLKKAGHSVTIFESSERIGGSAGSVREHGFTVERGANSLLDNEPSFQMLIDELGLRSRVIYTNNTSKNRMIFYNSKLHKVPLSPPDFIKTGFISPMGKIRALAEFFLPLSPPSNQESVYEFATRHFGRELAEKMILPAVIGVFAGDAKKLSLEKAFPALKSMETKSGSLIRALASKSSKPKGFSFMEGTQELITTLYSYLKEDIKLNTPVTNLQPHWLVNQHPFDKVVISTSLDCALGLVREIIPSLPNPKPNHTAPVISLSLGFNGPIAINGFGILIHPNEEFKTLGVLFPSDIFESRAPTGCSLLTLIMGGTYHPTLVNQTDEIVLRTALQELERILGPLPEMMQSWLFTYPHGITQYNIDSIDDFELIKTSIERHKGLYLNSQAYGGVSVNDCIRKSYKLAQQLTGGL